MIAERPASPPLPGPSHPARPIVGPHPYASAEIALGTKHGKERAIGPPLARALGVTLHVPAGLDTDQLGTFSGEVERPASPSETAVLKARLAIQAAGAPRGIASEGAFGPHPTAFFVSSGLEILVLVDEELGIQVAEQLLSTHTNLANTTAATLDRSIRRRVAGWGFPSHGLVVRANAPQLEAEIRKGVRCWQQLEGAIATSARESEDGRALIETDMRAHMNPTRMRQIALLARRFAIRLANRCPDCGAPGYGRVGVEAGLPCSLCSAPTRFVRLEIDGCSRCLRRRERPRSDGLEAADPGACDYCNP